MFTSEERLFIKRARASCDTGHNYEKICVRISFALFTALMLFEHYGSSPIFDEADYLNISISWFVLTMGVITAHFRSWNSDQSGSQQELKLIEFLEAKLAEVDEKAEN
ncbi:hypothetical protein N9L75_06665 [Porticoccaceae bacterium]|nr:hypothetical protein [Porticoccaceae bacterium]MDA8652239.1 hypothetical protein [Porticoccaceae bacterium]